ncbi:MAG: hypothetical protein AAGI52_00755 [Bacteroidota bacterium]
MLRALRCLLLAVLALIVGGEPVLAQYAEGGARRMAMGRTGVAVGGETWGQANPATWADASREVGVEASQAFGLSELRIAGASASLPLAVGTLAATGRVYGTDGYSETRLAVGIGRNVPLSRTRSLAVGLLVGYDAVSLGDFGSSGSVALALGIQGDLTPTVRAGAVLRNALGLLDDADTDLTRPLGAVPAVAAGLALRPSDRAFLALDVEQDLDGELSVRAGLEAQVVEPLAIRAGVGTAPVRYSAGIGVMAGPLRADIAAEVHEVLGLTPAVSLQVGF